MIQQNIFNAIETSNMAYFVDLAGHDSVDLNFCTQINYNQKNNFLTESFQTYPLMTACAKGELQMV